MFQGLARVALVSAHNGARVRARERLLGRGVPGARFHHQRGSQAHVLLLERLLSHLSHHFGQSKYLLDSVPSQRQSYPNGVHAPLDLGHFQVDHQSVYNSFIYSTLKRWFIFYLLFILCIDFCFCDEKLNKKVLCRPSPT